jgi:hypothetical protein
MDLATTVVLLGVAAAPLAVLGGWLASRDRSVAAPLGGGSDLWWREAMPWPHGVQEDDDVHFNFGDDSGPNRPRAGDDDGPVVTARLRPTVRRAGSRANAPR